MVYAASLCAELWCGGEPLAVRCDGKWTFPIFQFVPEDRYLANGRLTRTDYRRLEAEAEFRRRDGVIVWPLFRNAPNAILSQEEFAPALRVMVRVEAEPRIAGISVDEQGGITRFQGNDALVGGDAMVVQGRNWADFWEIPQGLENAVRLRLTNQAAERMEVALKGKGQIPDVSAVLTAYEPRARASRAIRITLRENAVAQEGFRDSFPPNGVCSEKQRAKLASCGVGEEFWQGVETCVADGTEQDGEFSRDGRSYHWHVEREVVRFPFRPAPGHWLGTDDAGRDVFARIVYATRVSLTFALVLVFCSLVCGTIVGAVQGYCGGFVDLTGQRLIEIWSALPFLYVVILLGSVYGPGFALMLVCYALFNWIGISYYMRAEMLRFRSHPFVEAARCLGLPAWRIVLKHILPNALVPLVTFFPFLLVGAIGSLAALDYLGFGLPPPTPSFGQLLQQAQTARFAWWLVLYPSLALFTLILCCVFIGEGVREAFDKN